LNTEARIFLDKGSGTTSDGFLEGDLGIARCSFRQSVPAVCEPNSSD
jgi:hypothetical protein